MFPSILMFDRVNVVVLMRDRLYAHRWSQQLDYIALHMLRLYLTEHLGWKPKHLSRPLRRLLSRENVRTMGHMRRALCILPW